MTEVAQEQLAAIEARLKDVYCRVLMLDSIASTDNILDVGGHSIPIMRIVSILRQELAIEVSVRDIFQAPTIAQLARMISGRTPPAGSSGKLVVPPAAELIEPAPVKQREPNAAPADTSSTKAGHYPQGHASTFSPADFPLARLDQNQIDHWCALYPALEDLYPATGMQRGLNSTRCSRATGASIRTSFT